MSKAIIATGDDSVILQTLKKSGATFNIPNSATVISRLVTLDHEVLSEQVTQVDSQTGADWLNSLIAVSLPAEVTSPIGNDTSLPWKNGKILAKLETQVNDNGKLTWFESLEIIKGTIS